MTDSEQPLQCSRGCLIDRGKEFWSVQADIAVRTEKNRTVMHGDDTSLVWFRGIATRFGFEDLGDFAIRYTPLPTMRPAVAV